MITLIGLGPGDSGGISMAARDALRAARCLFIRTAKHPVVAVLRTEGLQFEALDPIYDAAENFDSLYDMLAARILDAAHDGDVAYAVPGHPLVCEESVRRLLERAKSEGIEVRIAGSASFIEPVLAAVGRPVDDALMIIDALSLEKTHPRPEVACLFYQVYDPSVAANLKLALMRDYPDDFEAAVIRDAGVHAAESVEWLPIHRLDRIAADHLTSVYVPSLPKEQRKKRFDDLVWVMDRLRGEGGCPWDREQTHQTLKRYLIEECYETLDAIDSGDMDELVEELGDVLLQVVFHAQLATEEGIFDIDDVCARIVDKLVRRHPYVFSDLAVADTAEVLRNWETIKKAEKGEGWRDSVLDGVPSGLPALMRAMEISKRAVKAGFEWEKLDDVLSKLDEEVQELRHAIKLSDPERIADEIGDLLFTAVNVARWKKIDPEEALRTMLNRFAARFRYIEERARTNGRNLEEMTLAEMDSLWEEAKTENQR